MNARDHLANERTFLAWVRTGIALLGFGILIARLRFLIPGPNAGARSTWLGLAFAATGVLTLLFAVWHYARTRRMIDNGEYQSPASLIMVFTAALIGLGLASVFYLMTAWK